MFCFCSHRRMSNFDSEQDLSRDIRFALGKSPARKLGNDRDLVAKAIVEHLKLCLWQFTRGQPAGFFIRHEEPPPE